MKLSSTLILFVLGLGSLATNGAWSESLYVFYPSTARAKLLQEHIASHCKAFDVVVFGRQRDFQKRMLEAPPSFILAPSVVTSYYTKYTNILKARLDDKFDQAYYLVSVNVGTSLDKLSGKKIGVVDLLGAKRMNEYLSSVFSSADVRVKRVIKIEDLLPLISFNAVDTIFISESDLSFLRGKTELDLVKVETNVRLGIAELSSVVGLENADRAVKCVANFDKDLNRMFGVDGWK